MKSVEVQISLLHRAISLMQDNVSNGRFPYASLLARRGEILREAANLVPLPRSSEELPILESPLAHPELTLAAWLNAYVEKQYPGRRSLQLDLLSQVVLYTSCEPCGMCIRALAGAGLTQVVFAISSKTAATAQYFGNSTEPNVSVVQREYGLALSSVGPIEEEVALRTFASAWNQVRALEKGLTA